MTGLGIPRSLRRSVLAGTCAASVWATCRPTLPLLNGRRGMAASDWRSAPLCGRRHSDCLRPVSDDQPHPAMARLGSGELDAGEVPKDGPASQRKPFAPVMASNVVSLLANRMKLLEIAREMLHRDGPGASLIAHDRARHEARLGDPQSAA